MVHTVCGNVCLLLWWRKHAIIFLTSSVDCGIWWLCITGSYLRAYLSTLFCRYVHFVDLNRVCAPVGVDGAEEEQRMLIAIKAPPAANVEVTVSWAFWELSLCHIVSTDTNWKHVSWQSIYIYEWAGNVFLIIVFLLELKVKAKNETDPFGMNHVAKTKQGLYWARKNAKAHRKIYDVRTETRRWQFRVVWLKYKRFKMDTKTRKVPNRGPHSSPAGII